MAFFCLGKFFYMFFFMECFSNGGVVLLPPSRSIIHSVYHGIVYTQVILQNARTETDQQKT